MKRLESAWWYSSLVVKLARIIARTIFKSRGVRHYASQAPTVLERALMPDHVFWYAHRARGTLTVDHLLFDLTPQTLFYFPPGSCISIRSRPGELLSVYGCHFSPESEDSGFSSQVDIQSCVRCPDGTLGELFAQAAARSGGMTAEAAFLYAVFTVLLRRGACSRRALGGTESVHLEKFQRLRDYIGANYHRPLHVSDLAAHIRMDPSSVIRIFSRVAHTTPGMYLRRLRIAKAEELLSTGLRVKDAALRCGFSDEYTFIKSYKQLRSRTPGTYRRDRCGSPVL